MIKCYSSSPIKCGIDDLEAKSASRGNDVNAEYKTVNYETICQISKLSSQNLARWNIYRHIERPGPYRSASVGREAPNAVDGYWLGTQASSSRKILEQVITIIT